MDTKIRQLLGSSPRRIVTSALALGLVLGTSLLFTTAQPVWAVNFVQEVAVETRYAYAQQTAEKTCLIRAEQTLAAYGYTVWDPARENNRTVQGKKASSRVMVACVQDGDGPNTWAVINAHADDLPEATFIADNVRAKILGQAGSVLTD